MSRLHILARGQCVLHEPVPVGNNAAGVPWRTALVASGMGGTSILSTGANPWQNTTEEAAQIASGEVLEISFTVELKPGMSTAERNAAMDAQIANLSREKQAEIAQALRFFGLVR